MLVNLFALLQLTFVLASYLKLSFGILRKKNECLYIDTHRWHTPLKPPRINVTCGNVGPK